MKGEVAHRCHTAPIYAVCRARDEGIFTGGGDGRVLFWQASRPQEVKVVAEVPAAIQSIHHSEHYLFLGTSTGELFIIDDARRTVAHRFPTHAKGIFSIISIDAARIACAGGDGVLSIWLVADDGTVSLQRSLPLCDGKLRGLSLSSNGEFLAIACGDGALRVLDTTHFNEAATCAGHEGGASAVHFHPHKAVLLSGGKDGHMRAWSISEGFREVLGMAAHRSTVYGIAFDDHGRWLASASRDKTVKVWDATSLEPLVRLDLQSGGHTHSVNALCFAGDDLYSAGDDRKLIRWSLDQKG
ncbi:MAG: hypothetical protein IPL52_02515 [Flavobacteriales bacterium]|nr:hypothetical protein [Flavobacteriales bacterium]